MSRAGQPVYDNVGRALLRNKDEFKPVLVRFTALNKNSQGLSFYLYQIGNESRNLTYCNRAVSCPTQTRIEDAHRGELPEIATRDFFGVVTCPSADEYCIAALPEIRLVYSNNCFHVRRDGELYRLLAIGVETEWHTTSAQIFFGRCVLHTVGLQKQFVDVHVPLERSCTVSLSQVQALRSFI